MHADSARRVRRTALAATLAVLGVLGGGCSSTPAPNTKERARQLKIAVSRRNLGIDYLSQGENPLAIRELRRAEAIDPVDPVTVHWLGEAYRRRGLLEEAHDYFMRGIEMDPEEQEIRLNLAALYIQLERFPDAIAQCEVLIDDPTFASPWRALTNKGWALYLMDQYSGARESYREALAYQPSYWPARLNLGILEAKEGRATAAIYNFELVLESNVGRRVEAEANYRLGEVYAGMGRRKKALHHLKVAAERTPYGTWGEQSEAYLRQLH